MPPENEEKKPTIQALRTYKLDAAQTIKDRKESLASMVLAEQARRQAESDSGEHVIRTSKLRIFLSIAFMLGSALLVWGIIYLVQSYQSAERARISQIFLHDLILTESQKKVLLTQQNQTSIFEPLHAELRAIGQLNGTLEGVFYVEERPLPNSKKDLQQQSISAGTFISASKLRLPEALEQTFDAPFFVGIYHGKTSNPFLIFKIVSGSYPNAFSAMISWEPSMYADLAPLLSLPPVTLPPGNVQFADVVIMNKDIRILSTQYGEKVLFYTFFDKETLIITTSPEALTEIISRLTTPRKVIH